MKVLVTGHKGFIGSHVFDFLSDIFDVDGLDRPDDIEVNLAGTFAKDKFIVIKNKSKDPVVSALPHPLYDYEKNVFTEDGREEYLKEQWIKKEKK